MRIPKQLQIGGHTITVVRKSAVVDGDECYGTFDPKTLEITICPDIPESMALETFWHEVVEALNVFAETELDHNHIQVFGLLLGQVASSISWDVSSTEKKPFVATTEQNAPLAKAARKPSHKKRG